MIIIYRHFILPVLYVEIMVLVDLLPLLGRRDPIGEKALNAPIELLQSEVDRLSTRRVFFLEVGLRQHNHV